MRDDLPEVAKTPCVQCPWRKKASPGWLGPLSAEEWLAAVHGEAAIACHITIQGDEDEEDQDEWREGERQCAGAASFRANVFKMPRDRGVAYGPRDEAIFGSNDEFTQHHQRDPRELLD